MMMTILTGESLAAIPLIARAADHFGSKEDIQISRILTLLVICFPWLGELANLIFLCIVQRQKGFHHLVLLRCWLLAHFLCLLTH